MATVTGTGKIAFLTAILGTTAAAALLLASSLGIWMENANLNHTPRYNSMTVGCGIVPIPAVAWIVYLWARIRPRKFAGITTLVVTSLALLLVAAYCVFVAMIAALFVG